MAGRRRARTSRPRRDHAELRHASWNRLFHVYDAFKLGIPFHSIFEATGIDPWFLRQIEELVVFEKDLGKHTIQICPRKSSARRSGRGTRTVRPHPNCLESEVHTRRHDEGITRVYKLVDSALRIPALTPYYWRSRKRPAVWSPTRRKLWCSAAVPTASARREFDYCCVHGVLAAKECGYETIMINCNPDRVDGL